MNDEHLRLCASAEWAGLVADDLLPWVLADDLLLGDDVLGDDVLEVEIDPALTGALRARMAGRVEVITADATAMPLPDARFSAAACFTMLHHIPAAAGQDRALHVGDVFTPIDPAGFEARLTAAGFAAAEVQSNGDRFRFRARR